MLLSVTNTEAPNTVIRSARWNRNFDDVEDWANAHEIATTGVHGVTGNIVGTTDTQTLSNKIFDLTDVKIYGGYDLKLYSDSGTTLKASIDGATGNTSLEGTLGVTGASTLTGNVGIGASTTPDSTLHIFNGSAGAVTALAGTNFTLETSSAINYFSFLSPNTGSQATLFGDVDDNDIGAIEYNHNGDYLKIVTNAAERLRVGPTGAVGIISGQKLFLDGVALTGNTSIREAAADTIYFEAGGSDVVGITTTALSLNTGLNLIIQPTKKLFLDGGSNTSIRESAADVMTFETGGSDRLSIGSNGDCNFDSGTFYVDAANNRTYWGGTSINTSGSYDTAVRQVISSGTQFDSRICTSAGATGIQEETYHNSASPSNSDDIYTAIYAGNDNGGSYNIYAQKGVAIEDTTAGSEDAAFYFSAMKAGTLTNRIKLGSTDITIYDDLYVSANNVYDIGTTTVGPRDIYSNNALSLVSDGRKKGEIEQTDLGLEFIYSLNPVKYKWNESFKNVVTFKKVKTKTGEEKEIKKVTKVKKTDKEKRFHYGLIAQEVEKILDGKDFAGLCYDKDADVYMLRYEEFLSPIIKAIQELATMVKELKLKN